MDILEKEVVDFNELLKRQFGDNDSVENLLRKVLANNSNLYLVDCRGNIHYLHEPNANDCIDKRDS